MTMPSAPLLERVGRSVSARTNTDISLVYRAWANHYNSCATCQHDDWYEPLLGEERFCDEGKRLFRRWVSAAQITPPPLRARGHEA